MLEVGDIHGENTCKTHREHFSGAPTWTTSTVSIPYRPIMYCCSYGYGYGKPNVLWVNNEDGRNTKIRSKLIPSTRGITSADTNGHISFKISRGSGSRLHLSGFNIGTLPRCIGNNLTPRTYLVGKLNLDFLQYTRLLSLNKTILR